MPGRALLRTALLLWLAQPTLQGGTGYKPQNGGLGQMLIPSKGYGHGPQNANTYQLNTKAQGYGPAAPQPNGNGAKGYGAAQAAGNRGKPSGPYKGYGAVPAALGNGNGARPNGPYTGYGAVPAALGNGAKPNGPYKGYGAAPASLGNGNGAKPNGYGNNGNLPNGYGPAPVASKGRGPKHSGYGASPFTSNGQKAKPNPNGGYGSKPNKPGYGAQPSYGGFGAGMRIAPQMAYKGRGGYGQGNGYDQADSSFAGYRNGPASYPQSGGSLGGGYLNGAKAAKPGYGGGPLAQSGGAAKPNGYGPVAGGPNAQGAKPAGYGGTKGPKAGYAGYPNGAGIKGPKPGYGGLPTGYGQRSNGYGGYPNAGAKAPKPGYGVGAGNGGASNGQGAKPNGYGPVANGNEKGPKGKSLSPEAPSLPSVTGYTKGVAQPAKPEPTIGVPTALPPTKRMPLMSNWKGPKPQVPQGYPSQPIVQEQAPVNLQNKAPKPEQYVPQGQAPFPVLAPLIPQGKGPKPATQIAPEIPQGNPQKPVAPALLPFTQPEKAPKPVAQDQQLVAPVYPQGNGPKPVALQPAAPQGKGPKPVAPGLEIPQTKDPKPVAPEPDAPQTAGLPLALEPTPATPQMKGPKVANPDCGLGVSGQWTKLPSPGYGPGPWYPNSRGAKASKPGPGYGPKLKQPGYINPGAGYGYGNGGAGQLPYNGAPIIRARLDAGTSPIEPQTAELGPEVKSGREYGGPYGAQPMGLGSEGKPQVRYGIGGLLFSGSPRGYNSNPYGKYGNPDAASPYGSKAAGNYNPLEFNANPKSAGKYSMGGSPYTASTSDSGKYGPYGGQQLGLQALAGNSGKYGQSVGPYAPEPISLGGDAKSSGKYGNPSLPFEALGPVTDGQSIDQPVLQYEAPAIDGLKSVDQFGDGEVQPQPIAPLLDDRVGEGPASYIKGGVRAEVSLENPAFSPVDTPTEAATPQHIPVQQNLKGPQLPQSWSGGKEPKHDLKGFFGNGYHG
ncbi:calymmin isoform X2 [Ictalurus punctatus]|uniref:Calymmin isoform X2 n=1 Tax=Ictalurus punctatus TaxID=7998 RepID=A0A9F7TQB5_ICTPU|nr:calymmin isoform X2 [Ictalurus punctatus]